MSSLSLTCSFKKPYCIDMEVIQLFTSSTFYRNQSQAHKLIMLVRSLLPNLGRVRNLRRFLAVLPGVFARFYPGYFSDGAFSIS